MYSYLKMSWSVQFIQKKCWSLWLVSLCESLLHDGQSYLSTCHFHLGRERNRDKSACCWILFEGRYLIQLIIFVNTCTFRWLLSSPLLIKIPHPGQKVSSTLLPSAFSLLKSNRVINLTHGLRATSALSWRLELPLARSGKLIQKFIINPTTPLTNHQTSKGSIQDQDRILLHGLCCSSDVAGLANYHGLQRETQLRAVW